MSKVSQSMAEPLLPMPERSPNVIMGSQSFISVLGRSIAGELYKIRRRAMSKVLSTIAIATIILALLFTNWTSTQTLSEAIYTTLAISNFVGSILFIILAGTLVGGEYSVGSIRLMLTRGPSRLQFLLAKLGAMLICVCITLISLIGVGIITWMLLNLPVGHKIDFSFFTGNWLLHTFLFILTIMLSLFTYSMLTVCLSSWGKATAAGVTGVLIWWFLENAISGLLTLLGSRMQNALGNFIATVPEYFIDNNLNALRSNQQNYLMGGTTGAISDLHAGIVIIVYLAVFGGLTWWSLKTGDITS